MSQIMNKTAMVITLGCRLNQADSALLYSRFEHEGFSLVKPGKNAKPAAIVINTCTVTSNAARKSRQAARHFKRRYPDACLIITGCDCDKAIADWQNEEAVDFALPNCQKKNIPALLSAWQKKQKPPLEILSEPFEKGVFREDIIAEFPFKSRAFLKVQEGCNAYCTYCIVPYVRGPERSRAFEEIIEEAQALIKRGHSEIVITGVNISTYCDGDKKIVDVLQAIIDLPGDFRIRLSSMEPHIENNGLLTLIKNNPKMCRFLHIPLQSGSDAVLAGMQRNYTTAEFGEFAKSALTEIPGLHLGTDVIVGFPGETDTMFQNTCEFIKKIGFANMHVFRFSPRKGTPAADYPDQIPQIIVKQRAEFLTQIAEKSKQNFIKAQIGSILPVLLEKKISTESFEGWSDNYIRITVSGRNLKVGTIAAHQIKDSNVLSL